MIKLGAYTLWECCIVWLLVALGWLWLSSPVWVGEQRLEHFIEAMRSQALACGQVVHVRLQRPVLGGYQVVAAYVGTRQVDQLDLGEGAYINWWGSFAEHRGLHIKPDGTSGQQGHWILCRRGQCVRWVVNFGLRMHQ